MQEVSKEPEIRYKHVEAVLSRIFKVSSDKEGAFRARLRHLRNMGIPDLPRPGSGTQIAYTRLHLIQMVIALELSALGIAPRHAADLAERVLLAERTAPQESSACRADFHLFAPGEIYMKRSGKRIALFGLPSDRPKRFGGKGQVLLIVYPGTEFAPAGDYEVEVKELNKFEIAAEAMANSRISFVNLSPSIKALDEFLKTFA